MTVYAGSTFASLVMGDQVNSSVYTSPEVFEQEMQRIFGRTWIFIGHASEVPNPGDFKTVQVGQWPLLMTRHSDGLVRVLFNVCRHRGSKVCYDAFGNTNSFMCMYHGWTYDTAGALNAVPHARPHERPRHELVRVGASRPCRDPQGFRVCEPEPRGTHACGAPGERRPLPRRDDRPRSGPRDPRNQAHPLRVRRELEAPVRELLRQLSSLVPAQQRHLGGRTDDEGEVRRRLRQLAPVRRHRRRALLRGGALHGGLRRHTRRDVDGRLLRPRLPGGTRAARRSRARQRAAGPRLAHHDLPEPPVAHASQPLPRHQSLGRGPHRGDRIRLQAGRRFGPG